MYNSSISFTSTPLTAVYPFYRFFSHPVPIIALNATKIQRRDFLCLVEATCTLKQYDQIQLYVLWYRQVLADERSSPSSDVFAFGITLYEMFSRRIPYESERDQMDTLAVLAQVTCKSHFDKQSLRIASHHLKHDLLMKLERRNERDTNLPSLF